MLERLPESTQALAVELRDHALALAPRLAELPFGTPVAKSIGRATYWYLQSRGGGLDHQRYLGPESPELSNRIERWRASREALGEDLADLSRLNEMVISGGVPRESAATTRVLELLADAGVFRRDGVLVGTRAFAAYGPLVGFRATAVTRTQDVDLAVPRALAVAVPREPASLVERLGETEPPFLPVPDLDPRRASTSFKLRGRELRVDFVTTRRRSDGERPVPIPALGLAAWPLELVDYLVAEPIAAVVCGTRPVLVRVPQPARFALHKLWLSSQRPASEAARARKDLAQTTVLLALLVEDRPADLERAAAALPRRRGTRQGLRSAVGRLPHELRGPLLALLF